MAKFPRSNRKMFQMQKKVLCLIDYMSECPRNNANCDCSTGTLWEVWGIVYGKSWGRLEFFDTKKQARQYIIEKRRAIKNRLW